MKNFEKLKIYVPTGFLKCKHLKEIIVLHLLEHLICKNISKKLNISLYDLNGKLNLDYMNFEISISKANEIDIIQDIFKNLEQNLKQNSKELEIEKKRILEEERFIQYDTIRQVHQTLFIKIFKNFRHFTLGQLKKILRSITLDDVLFVQKKFISYENLLILGQTGKNKIRILKKPYKLNKSFNYLITNQRILFLKNKFIPSTFVFALISDNEPDYLLFLRFLDKKHRTFFETNLINKGLVYSCIQMFSYLLLGKIIFTIIIPSSKVNRLFKIYKKDFRKFLDLSFKKEFSQFKKSEIKRMKKNFFNFFEPYLIKNIFENGKYPTKKEIFNKLEKVKPKNIIGDKLKPFLIKINS